MLVSSVQFQNCWEALLEYLQSEGKALGELTIKVVAAVQEFFISIWKMGSNYVNSQEASLLRKTGLATPPLAERASPPAPPLNDSPVLVASEGPLLPPVGDSLSPAAALPTASHWSWWRFWRTT